MTILVTIARDEEPVGGGNRKFIVFKGFSEVKKKCLHLIYKLFHRIVTLFKGVHLLSRPKDLVFVLQK